MEVFFYKRTCNPLTTPMDNYHRPCLFYLGINPISLEADCRHSQY